MKFLRKNENLFQFLLKSKGGRDPLNFLKIEKKFQIFFIKISITKNFVNAQFMKLHQILYKKINVCI